MALPEQIRKQSESVQKLYQQLNAEVSGEGEPEGGENPPVQEPEQQAQPETPEGSGQPDKGQRTDEDMAQKYRTLQGMYNAEVPRLHQQNKDLNNRVQQMQQLLASLSQQQQERPREQESGTPTMQIVTPKDVEDFGEDSIDVMRRVSREEYAPVIQKIASLEQMVSRLAQHMQGDVMPQVQQVMQRQALTADQQFWMQLQTAVPDWKEINTDPDFHTWLLEVDPLFGTTRQSILEVAQRNYDVNRVTQFFRTWKQLTGNYGANQSAGNTKNTQRSELERQVAPGRSRNTNAPAGSQPKTYTPKDIEKFFSDVRQGKYKGREQERDRIERDIFAAQKDGRIVANG